MELTEEAATSPPAQDILDRIVQENLGVYRASVGRLQEDVSQEAQVASDYRGRLVYELLQNSDDAMAADGGINDRVAFVITENELWVANSGRPLTEADIRGLCGLGASSKVGATGSRRASIGHKGLGFKSVLELTDTPETFSRSHSFALGPEAAMREVTALWGQLGHQPPKHVPHMRFPTRLSTAPEQWRRFLADGYNTAFRLPYKTSFGQAKREELSESLLRLPLTTVLFLKHLEHIDVESRLPGLTSRQSWTVERRRSQDDVGAIVPSLDRSGSYVVRVQRVDGEGATFLLSHAGDLEIGPHRSGLAGPAWDGVTRTEVSVAALHPDEALAMPLDWRRFHVFLPTQEVNDYPLLVNGAFGTDLSRRHVAVSSDPYDYNSHLVRKAAQLVTTSLLPELLEHGPDAVFAVLDRSPALEPDDAASLFHQALTSQLGTLPFVPTEADGLKTIPSVVLPALELGESGEQFRNLLPPHASLDELPFPDAASCHGARARVLVDHGARLLDVADTLESLALGVDAERSRLQLEPDGRFHLDPVLEVATALWQALPHDERVSLRSLAKQLPLFTVGQSEDGTVERIVLADSSAFYPPRAAAHETPLQGLAFLSHAICWGTVSKGDRKAVLGDRMQAWNGLFDLGEFDFPDVVRAAVLPALVQDPQGQAAERLAALASREALTAICDLAGSSTKPDRPLRYQRLEADQALFRLARLPVPCRGERDGELVWQPAYRVYFGADWIGSASVEDLLAALPQSPEGEPPLAPPLLAPPEYFLGQLDLRHVPPAGEAAGEDDIVEDDEAALEVDERDRWIAFLSWLGVNRCLRLVHFHDVDDVGTGWLTTKGITQPKGWAFAGLDGVWSDFAESVTQHVASAGQPGVVPYVYRAHDLDMIEPILACAEQDATGDVAGALFSHLAAHWTIYGQMSEATVALVPEGKVPSMRTPPRAITDELRSAGDDLWLRRLRLRGVCPTSRGPRAPEAAWQPSREIERRFGRNDRPADLLLPVLRGAEGGSAARTLADRLGVRRELSPSTFGPADAETVCERVRDLFPHPVPADLFRIKPIYRAVFELLTGDWSARQGALAHVPLLALTPAGLQYLTGPELLHARTPGSRERSGVSDAISVFVLEAEPSVAAPIVSLFGARILETSLVWSAEVEERAFSDEDAAELRGQLTALEPILLARVKVERSAEADAIRDQNVVRSFLREFEPVRSLQLTCSLDGEVLAVLQDRPYHLESRPGRSEVRPRVMWPDQPWPPTPEAASAMALALSDSLGMSLVEAFDSLIRSDPQHRRRLLALSGGEGHLEEIENAAPTEDGTPSVVPEGSEQPTPMPRPATDEKGPESTPPVRPAASVIPLYAPGSLEIFGQALLIEGELPAESTAPTAGSRGASGPGSGRAAAGTDLVALDALGMQVTIAYEVHRLATAGRRAGTLSTDGDGRSWVLAVDTPAHIEAAIKRSSVVAEVVDWLQKRGVSRLHPGFDVLTIEDGAAARLIELKSSGVDARVQEMSWNEWKSAGASGVREHFWLYLVGNLRADLPDARPFIRMIEDPFKKLRGEELAHDQRRRVMQLRVREFEAAEQLELGVATSERHAEGLVAGRPAVELAVDAEADRVEAEGQVPGP